MTIAAGTALPGLGAPAHDLRGAARRAVGPVLALAVCGLGIGALVPPVLHSVEAPPAAGTVTVKVLGTISTAGLPAAAAVSSVTVRNDGDAPFEWSARPTATGSGAAGVVIEAWLPTAAGCTAPTRLLSASEWSATPLQPGASAQVCVRVSTNGTSAGTATPHLDVAARAV